MSKNLLSALAIFCLTISSALAMPNVGDDVLFDMTATVNGHTYQGSTELKLQSFNASANQWTEVQIVKIAGQTQTQTQQLATSDLITDTQAQQVLQECAQAGGKPQSLKVPAGSFNTCALPVKNNDGTTGTIWVAEAVFGYVKMDITKGTQHIVLEMRDQVHGH